MRGKLWNSIRRWIQLHNPWYLRRQNLALQRFIDKQNSEISQLKVSPDEQTARAMLMQLRVHQESIRHRTGYMVSAFIPQGVVEKLNSFTAGNRAKFVSVVAESLVNNALSGILRRNSATNKLTALIFEPITSMGQNVKLVGGIFETDQRPEYIPMEKTNRMPPILINDDGVISRPLLKSI